jgi:alkylresorcinol/alkylpyrone synthase
MSSPTVLFVLERCLARRPARGALGVAMAFGPGLTLESFLLRAL